MANTLMVQNRIKSWNLEYENVANEISRVLEIKNEPKKYKV